MALFSVTTMVVEQSHAYARHFAESRDIAVAVWGLLFVLTCLLPALFLDIFFLPVRILSRISPAEVAASVQSNSGAER